jgi:hypothetical protein
MGEMFASYSSDKGLIFLNQLKKFNIVRTNNITIEGKWLE